MAKLPIKTLKKVLEHRLGRWLNTKVTVTIEHETLTVRPIIGTAFLYATDIVEFANAVKMCCYLDYDAEKKHIYARIF